MEPNVLFMRSQRRKELRLFHICFPQALKRRRIQTLVNLQFISFVFFYENSGNIYILQFIDERTYYYIHRNESV